MAARLWDWALRAYAAPGVRQLCLQLQDEHDQSVCLLLWAGWAAACGRWPDDEGLAAAAALARRWEGQIVAPMRAARRALKIADGIDETSRASLRAQVQAAELAAERALLAALEAIAPAAAARSVDPAAALAAAGRAYGASAPLAMLKSLSAGFPTA